MPGIYDGPTLSLTPADDQVRVRVFFNASFSARDSQLYELGHRYRVRLTLLGVDNDSLSRLHTHYYPVTLVPSTTIIYSQFDIQYTVERSLLREDIVGADEIRCQVEIFTYTPANIVRQSNMVTLPPVIGQIQPLGGD